jgi:hypothetical protein
MGKDGAREATFQGKASYPSGDEQWDGNWIFQAKFHDVQQIGPQKAREDVLRDLDRELWTITKKYRHPCDNYILVTNVSLTPVFQTGTKDKIDKQIIPKYTSQIRNIHVWGAEEICRFLDAYPDIRQTYVQILPGDIIARLLKLVEEQETELDELIKLYCQGCFIHEQYAVLDDARDIEDERVALQKIFIDLNVNPPTLVQKFSNKRLPRTKKEQKRISALSYLLDDAIPGIVLIGAPGSGKSTLGQFLAQVYRARLIGALHDFGQDKNAIEQYENCILRIPFRILLREYAQWVSSSESSDSLFYYLASQISKNSGRDVKPKEIQDIVKSNASLFILDGLDEVPEKNLRRKVLDNITSCVRQIRNVLKGNLKVIATTRPHGYSKEFDSSQYIHLELQTLEKSQAVKYTKRWLEVREFNPNESKRIENSFVHCLEDNIIQVLTQTPLQVTIILVIIRARGMPPKQREELFEYYMDIIYQREQKKHPELLQTERAIIYGLHQYLAYILHKRAEKDQTAALMEVSEFREEIRKFLACKDPLLNEQEQEDRLDQIIREAHQRLVLIESPVEGKLGFGLTPTREFFAAAHLVDTAKDTQERDVRFKAIARAPHWRNVALFFAGRIGRTLPGEASSMIDVCRAIDNEGTDIFLKRGAELVMEIVDDRALREPHNEISALQYALEILDTGFVKDFNKWIDKLKNLPEKYKKRVICPWLEERIKMVTSENLRLYITVYHEIGGNRKLFTSALKKASECNVQEVKLWILSLVVKNGIVGGWAKELFKELVGVFPLEKIASVFNDCDVTTIQYYLNSSLSIKEKMTLAYALTQGVSFLWLEEDYSLIYEFRDIELIDFQGEIQHEEFAKNALFMQAVALLVLVSENLRSCFKS